MHITWIQKHWGKDFVTAAKKKILEMVSLFISDCPKIYPNLSPKMRDYYKRKTDTNIEPRPVILETWEKLSYMSLPATYKLDDMEIGIGVCDQGQNRPTIKQEYQIYVTPPFTMQSHNPFKFWKVCGINSG